MSITNLIVHRIERRPDTETSELRTRATPLTSNNISESFLEDLVAAAINDANRKVEQATQDKMSSLTAGMNLPPGMNLPF